MKFEDIMLTILITALAYMAIPYIYLIAMNKICCINLKKLKLFLVGNSIILGIIFAVITFIKYPDSNINPLPAIFYYYTNWIIYRKNKNLNTLNIAKKEKIKVTKKEEKEEIKKEKDKIADRDDKYFSKNKVIYVVLIISIIANISLIVKNSNLESDLLITNNTLYHILNDKSAYYINTKLQLIDDSIVFVISDYPKYYMNYDCMKNITSGTKFSYLAFNKENAIKMGYKEYNCQEY